MTANGGTATIPANQTEIQVTHGLGGVPTVVLAFPQQDMADRRVWSDPDDADATYFKIKIDSADPFNSFSFYWYGST